jgi:hypothetical protein
VRRIGTHRTKDQCSFKREKTIQTSEQSGLNLLTSERKTVIRLFQKINGADATAVLVDVVG